MASTSLTQVRLRILSDLQMPLTFDLSATKPSRPPSPSRHLPTEILLHIFAFCVAPDESNNEAFTALHIVRVSHVCHVWREISLAYPPFWSNIAFKTPFLATTMLERSKPTPIVIRANLTPGGGQFDDTSYRIRCMFKAVSRALRSSDRAKEIDLRSGPSKHLSKAFDDIRPATSQLEYLALRGYGDNLRSTVFDVPGSIFSHCLFPLQTLILERCHLIPSSLFGHCTHLTHLELRSVTAFSIGDIVNIFRLASWSLQSIMLDSLPLHAGPVDETSQVILPHLSLLHFNAIHGDSHAHNVFFLLHFIAIPPTASLVLQFLIFGSTRQIPLPIINTLTRHFSAGEPIRSLIVFQANLHKRRGLRIRGWTRATLPRFFYADDAPSPNIDVHFVWEEEDDNSLIERILPEFATVGPLHAVQTLTIARVSVLSVAAMDVLLLMLPSVREVCVHGSTALRALYGLELNGSAVNRAPPLARLRELRSLTIHEASFRNGETHDVSLRALCDRLDELSAKGYGVTELIVCYSDASRQDMEELAKHAREFLWDGSTNGTSGVPVPPQLDLAPANSRL